MSILIVNQGKDGRGKIQPFSDGKNHAGETFFVMGNALRVQKDNRIYIPKSIFTEIGNSQIVIQTGATYENAQKVQGANILKSSKIEKFARGRKTGERVPKSVAGEAARGKGKNKMKVLKPKDSTYIYTG